MTAEGKCGGPDRRDVASLRVQERPRALLVGPASYVGGISVHMHRLVKLLRGEVEFGILDDSPRSLSKCKENIRSPRVVLRLPFILRGHDLVHIHSGHWAIRFAVCVLSRLLRRHVIVTLHSYRAVGAKRRISRLGLRCASLVICVNQEIFDAVDLDRKVLMPAYLPPDDSRGITPDEVKDFITRNAGKRLLVANAYRLTLHEGRDLYGLDLCIELAARFARDGVNAVVIFVVARVDPGDDLLELGLKEIDKRGLADQILVYPRSLDFVELMRSADVVLRPTLTDGDALTIREGLFLGKPVVASDTVARPKGTLCFRTGDADDFFRVACKALVGSAVEALAQDSEVGSQREEFRTFYRRVFLRDSPLASPTKG